MPKFSEYTDVEFEVDVIDFLDECSEEDIDGLIDELEDRGYLLNMRKTTDEYSHFDDDEWNKIILKLSNPYVRLILSNEDIELIKQIANKL